MSSPPTATERRRAIERRLAREHPGPYQLATLGVASGVAASIAWIGFAVILAVVVGRVFVDGADLGVVRALVAWMVALLVARSALLWLGDEFAGRGGGEMVRRVRGLLTVRLFELGPTFARGRRAGELVYAAGEGAGALDPYLGRYRNARLLASIVPVLIALAVLALDPWSALVLAVTGPLLVWLLAILGRRVRDAGERREEELSWMSAHFLDVLRGLPTLKLFGRSREQAATIQSIGERNEATTMGVLKAVFQTSLVLEWGAVAATAFVAVEVSVRLVEGTVSFPRALAVLLLTPEFFVPLRRLAAEYHAGSTGVAAATRIAAVLDEPARMPTTDGGGAAMPERMAIHFDEVALAFDGGERPALRGLTLEIPAGSFTALVGPTSAGKSTAADLLLRFIEPDAGEIRVGDVPLASLDVDAWRCQVAWVPQHPALLHGTVAANLRLAVPGADADDDALRAALDGAGALAFVEALPDGLATPIGENGVRLSGGERQRLAIARAFLRDAPLLILDEATSHLDADAQAHVLATLASMRDRTVLVIAHRMELVRSAEQVVVLEEGRVVESGTPAELLGAGRAFRRFADLFGEPEP